MLDQPLHRPPLRRRAVLELGPLLLPALLPGVGVQYPVDPGLDCLVLHRHLDALLHRLRSTQSRGGASRPLGRLLHCNGLGLYRLRVLHGVLHALELLRPRHLHPLLVLDGPCISELLRRASLQPLVLLYGLHGLELLLRVEAHVLVCPHGGWLRARPLRARPLHLELVRLALLLGILRCSPDLHLQLRPRRVHRRCGCFL
mmetsp:Transcript_46620/g.125186  ORF Transcript_46620/g.125186 Transcript_46620/m.125186 type:complete len:201 (+) Transcript_46620:1743-2345(+)